MYKEDTIAAIATPVGEGGIAVVRISGPDAERIGQRIFFRRGGKNGALQTHTLHHGLIRNPQNDQVLDEVLFTVMRRPRSYTGEDIVEVHSHGGSLVARAILELILSQGARQADRGEFTRRAFLNGRLDLTQAEAVLDLIRSRTAEGMRLAAQQVSGELSKWVGELREELLDILAEVEAAIDFPEEEIELLKREEMTSKILNLKEKISQLVSSYEWGRLFRDGARVCIVGRPNVGKSSLLNAFLGEERVIVTPVPGTTRDVIEEGVNLDGLPIVLWDTAGLRETEDQIEKIGVNFTLKHLDQSDAVLVVMDGSLPLTPEDKSVLIETKAKKRLFVINKNDLHRKLQASALSEIGGEAPLVSISAKNGEGLEALKKALRELLLGVEAMPAMVLSNLRHKTSLEKSAKSLCHSLETLADKLSPELLAIDLQDAKESLEEIIGVVSNDDILERIFSKFCIGK